jgi:ABC transporter family protein
VSPAAAVPAPPAVAVLRAVHITKRFGGLDAVKDVSIDVPQHSIVSLIGPNGAGKTTLFNMLTGLYRPTEGSILLGELDITRARADEITGRGVARTFQNIRLFCAPPGSAGKSGKHARAPVSSSRTLACARRSSTGLPRSCRTGTSEGWRSRGRWRRSRECCCSTSPPPA